MEDSILEKACLGTLILMSLKLFPELVKPALYFVECMNGLTNLAVFLVLVMLTYQRFINGSSIFGILKRVQNRVGDVLSDCYRIVFETSPAVDTHVFEQNAWSTNETARLKTIEDVVGEKAAGDVDFETRTTQKGGGSFYDDVEVTNKTRFARHIEGAKAEDPKKYEKWAQKTSKEAVKWIDELEKAGDTAPLLVVVGIVNAGKSALVQQLFGINSKTGVEHVKSVVIEKKTLGDHGTSRMCEILVVDLPGIQEENDQAWEPYQEIFDKSQKVLFAMEWTALEKPEICAIVKIVKKALAQKRGRSIQEPTDSPAIAFDHLSLVVTKMDTIAGSYPPEDPRRKRERQEVVANVHLSKMGMKCFFVGIKNGSVQKLPEVDNGSDFKALKEHLLRAVEVEFVQQAKVNRALKYAAGFSERWIIRVFAVCAAGGGITTIPLDSQLWIALGCVVLIYKHHQVFEWQLFQTVCTGPVKKAAVFEALCSLGKIGVSYVFGYGYVLTAARCAEGISYFSNGYNALESINNILREQAPGDYSRILSYIKDSGKK